MKRTIALALAALGTFHSPLAALHSNKTFLSSRPEAQFLPHEVSLWHKTLREQSLSSQGEGLQVTGIYGESQNRSSLGKYFMFRGKQRLLIGSGVDIDNQHLKFDETSPGFLTGEISLVPHTETYGARFDYFQYLNHIAPHLFLHAAAQLTQVQYDPLLTLSRGTFSRKECKSIRDYFKGETMLEKEDGKILRPLQEPLMFGKIDGKHDRTGVSDLHLELGYDLVASNDWLLRSRAELIVPTCDSDNAKFLFAPRLGTGGHWGVGARLDGAVTLWHGDDGTHELYNTPTFELLFDARLNYLFKNHERRMLGLQDANCNELCWAQYMLVGKAGCPLVLPAANVLAQNVSVSPGFQFEGLLMLAHTVKGFTINLGYDAWITDAEDISRKDKWDNCTYGFVGKEFADEICNFAHFNGDMLADSAFSLDRTNLNNTISNIECSGLADREQGFITENQLLTSVAQTPAIFTNTIFFGVGKHWDNAKCTTMFGGGFAYEWSTNNAALEQFFVSLKAAILFK